MQLYATVTSERATKGQGGKYLDIDITIEDGTKIAMLKVEKTNGGYGLQLTSLSKEGGAMRFISEDDIKGEKQKDEHPKMNMPMYGCHCEDCKSNRSGK